MRYPCFSNDLYQIKIRAVVSMPPQTLCPVLKLRFGLEDGKARTLEEVGQVFNVTRERIRQIEAKALKKLKNPVRGRMIQDYLKS